MTFPGNGLTFSFSWIVAGVVGVLFGNAVANPGYFFSSGPKYSPSYNLRFSYGSPGGHPPSRFSHGPPSYPIYSIFSKPPRYGPSSSPPYGSSASESYDEDGFSSGSYEGSDGEVPPNPSRGKGNKHRGNFKGQNPEEEIDENFNLQQDEEPMEPMDNPDMQTQSMDDIQDLMANMDSEEPESPVVPIMRPPPFRQQPEVQRRPQMVLMNSMNGRPMPEMADEALVMNPDTDIETEEIPEMPRGQQNNPGADRPSNGGWGRRPTNGGNRNRGKPTVSSSDWRAPSQEVEEDGFKPGLPPSISSLLGQGWPSVSSGWGPSNSDNSVPSGGSRRPLSNGRAPPKRRNKPKNKRPNGITGSPPSRNTAGRSNTLITSMRTKTETGSPPGSRAPLKPTVSGNFESSRRPEGQNTVQRPTENSQLNLVNNEMGQQIGLNVNDRPVQRPSTSGQAERPSTSGQGQTSTSYGPPGGSPSAGPLSQSDNNQVLGSQGLSSQDGLLDEDLIRTVQEIISKFEN